jgi:hypothetical protein
MLTPLMQVRLSVVAISGCHTVSAHKPCLTAFLAAARALSCPPHSLIVMFAHLKFRVCLLSSHLKVCTDGVHCRCAWEMLCWHAGACALPVSARWLETHPHCITDPFCFMSLRLLHSSQPAWQVGCEKDVVLGSRALGLRAA